MTGNGPYVVDPSVIGPDGRAVAPDGARRFSGQVFFNPGAGDIGALQRRMFSGPWTFDMDAGIQKLTHITEHQTVEFRMEAGNVFNHPTFVRRGSEHQLAPRSAGDRHLHRPAA